jgi:hypothetical protein
MQGGVNLGLQFRARCSRCGYCAFEAPDRLDLGADFACKGCGHRGKLVEFADVATLDAILETLKKSTGQALGDRAISRSAG